MNNFSSALGNFLQVSPGFTVRVGQCTQKRDMRFEVAEELSKRVTLEFAGTLAPSTTFNTAYFGEPSESRKHDIDLSILQAHGCFCDTQGKVNLSAVSTASFSGTSCNNIEEDEYLPVTSKKMKSLGAKCVHVSTWKRLRARKGFVYFSCLLCGAHWHIPSRGNSDMTKSSSSTTQRKPPISAQVSSPVHPLCTQQPLFFISSTAESQITLVISTTTVETTSNFSYSLTQTNRGQFEFENPLFLTSGFQDISYE